MSYQFAHVAAFYFHRSRYQRTKAEWFQCNRSYNRYFNYSSASSGLGGEP